MKILYDSFMELLFFSPFFSNPVMYSEANFTFELNTPISPIVPRTLNRKSGMYFELDGYSPLLR